ncbi:MAG: hypothetical protein M3Y07_15495, partial [Acidobacteriota bacterium]|nr:hypothetical protein [Acidobacteriota bacterium]
RPGNMPRASGTLGHLQQTARRPGSTQLSPVSLSSLLVLLWQLRHNSRTFALNLETAVACHRREII